jgi:hypothetical protein
MKKTVSILGTKYTVHLNVPEHKDEGLMNRFGYCTPTMQKIVIADLDTIDSWKDETSYSKRVQTNITLRHEIIHAFLHESGLWGSSLESAQWALNEEMVDWVAIQFPKILKVFKQLGCEGEI